MKKTSWVVSVVLTGLFLLAQGLQPQVLLGQNEPVPAAESAAADSKPAAKAKTPDRAAAYYHFVMAHMYEEQMAAYGRSELANKAMEEYRAAIEADPTSSYLTSGLAELTPKPAAFVTPWSRRKTSSSAIPTTSKPGVCSGGFICARSATCNREMVPRVF